MLAGWLTGLIQKGIKKTKTVAKGHRHNGKGKPRFTCHIFALCLLFVLTPIFVLVISSFNQSRYFEFPPTGFTLEWYKAFYASKRIPKSIIDQPTSGIDRSRAGLLAGVQLLCPR
jgi:ABC-type Fe3+ transport system permease subunit